MGKNGPHTQKRNKKKKKSCFLSKNLMAVVITTRKPEDQVRFSFLPLFLFYFSRRRRRPGEISLMTQFICIDHRRDEMTLRINWE
jgi:hypothetical protein